MIPDEIAPCRALPVPRPTRQAAATSAPALPRGQDRPAGGGRVGLRVGGGQRLRHQRHDRAVQGIISIPFPSQIAQVRARRRRPAAGGANKGSGRRFPFDPPSGRQSDRLPALSPKMTVATDSLILSNILATIANEDIRYVGIVATDILDVIYLTRLIRENCPDVQIILVGNDLRYTDPQFTLDFRGTIIASSYPLDAGPRSGRTRSRGRSSAGSSPTSSTWAGTTPGSSCSTP